MLPICTSGPKIKVKVVVTSKAQSYYFAEQVRESGTLGHAPSGKYKYYNFFVLIASLSIKIQSKGDEALLLWTGALLLCTGWSGCIEALLLYTGWSGCIDTALWQP